VRQTGQLCIQTGHCEFMFFRQLQVCMYKTSASKDGRMQSSKGAGRQAPLLSIEQRRWAQRGESCRGEG
jgi:hypothetical protein